MTKKSGEGSCVALDLRGEPWQPATDFEPSDGALDLWKCPLQISDSDWHLLSNDETERGKRRVIPAKRDQFVAARAALRRLLALYLEPEAQDFLFESLQHGRPRLVEEQCPAGFDFNLSHSHEMALVAIVQPPGMPPENSEPVREQLPGRLTVGADLEFLGRERPFSDMVRRFFSASEVREYEALPEAEQLAAFHRTWCRKEAYLKAWGTGLTFSSRRFSVAVSQPWTGDWLMETEMPHDEVSRWSVADLDLSLGEPQQTYFGACCFDGTPSALRLFEAVQS